MFCPGVDPHRGMNSRRLIRQNAARLRCSEARTGHDAQRAILLRQLLSRSGAELTSLATALANAAASSFCAVSTRTCPQRVVELSSGKATYGTFYVGNQNEKMRGIAGLAGQSTSRCLRQLCWMTKGPYTESPVLFAEKCREFAQPSRACSTRDAMRQTPAGFVDPHVPLQTPCGTFQGPGPTPRVKCLVGSRGRKPVPM